MRKRIAVCLASAALVNVTCGFLWFTPPEPPGPPVRIGRLALTGEIHEENAVFTLAFEAKVRTADARLRLVAGPVAYLDGELPPGGKLEREADAYYLTFPGRGTHAVAFRFAARPVKKGDWRETGFALPEATVRSLTLTCDRADMEVQFRGALNVERTPGAGGHAVVSAFLSAGSDLGMQWKPQVRKLDADLVVACDANSIATARVGALQLHSFYTYRVVQGSLQRLRLELPAGLNVTQVRGADIREWSIEEEPGGARVLVVVLARPKDRAYTLGVESERVLSDFPCRFDFPVLAPRDVIRASGFLLIGADSAIKLLVDKAAGLTQIDQSAFPAVAVEGLPERARPGRSVYAYQYANLPFQMGIAADDIVTAVHAEQRLVLSLADTDLGLDAAIDVEVRDAPARELVIETEPGWIVANVAGQHVADYDVQDAGAVRRIHVYLREALLGRTLVNVRLERPLKDEDTVFKAPVFRVQDAKSSRGYLVLRAEAGLRLEPSGPRELREVPPGSLPVRVNDAQYAYRFKSDDWALDVGLRKEVPSIHAELFHLASLGEGMLYGSCSATYNIGNAPVRVFPLHIPAAYQNVEITGRDLRGWTQEGETWKVSLQEKVSGDYTLLVTYSQPVAYEGDALLLGGIRTLGTESEVGYLAVAGSAGLAFGGESARDPSVLPVAAGELPKEYALLVRDPILQAYKYVAAPHEARVSVKRHDTQPLLEQVTDHMVLTTRLSREGEAVTEAVCFVKNTSEQYLGIQIPAGARLWSATVDGETVSALEDGEGGVLVPVPRRRDPNQPSRVQLVYAEQHAKLGVLSRVRFEAPAMASRSVFAKWVVAVPARYRIAGASGNMMLPPRGRAGLPAVAWRLGNLFRALVRHGWGWLALFALVAGVAWAVTFQAARGRPFAWGTWAALLLGLFLAVVLVRLRLPWALRRALAEGGAWGPATQWELTKPVTLADARLQVGLSVLRAWASWTLLGLRALLGVAVAAWLWRGVRCGASPSGVRRALAPVALVWGVAGLPGAASVSAAVLAAAFPVAALAAVVRGARAAGRRRLAAAPEPPAEPETPAPPPPLPPAPEPPPVPAGPSFASRIPAEPEAGPSAGAARAGLLPVLLAAALAAGAVAVRAAPEGAAAEQAPRPRRIVADEVELTVTAPELPKALVRNAVHHLLVAFRAKRGEELFVVPTPGVLTGAGQLPDGLEIVPGDGGYTLKVLRDGAYRAEIDYLAPVEEGEGEWRLPLALPPNVRNTVLLTVPGAGWEVESAEAIFAAQREEGGAVRSELRMGSATRALVRWRPRERKTGLEQAVFFCDLNSFALFQPGVVSLTHVVRYQIAQGELQSLELEIAEGMSVTAVSGPGLSTWRYDPDTRRLEALLEKPVSGEYALVVVEQIPRESLPYRVELREPRVPDAVRQRGSLAVASTEAVQVQLGETAGLNGMNVGDFSAGAVQAALHGQQQGAPEIRRAFRYHQLPVSAAVSAERVLPEIRVAESASVDVTDERVVLGTRLELAVAKAGIFSVRIDLPRDFDVDSLTGDDVSHWDEVQDGGRGVVVHFTRQALGARTLNLVLSRMERTVPPELAVPRVAVRDALKHTGTLAVSGERGLRFTTTAREGVSELNPRELGIQQPGYLAFRLLRPDWSVSLRTEALAPVVKAELLQRVDLSEGMRHIRCYLQYAIEHAGVKTFRLRAPAPGVALTVTGRHIARVEQIDAAAGLWEVELQNKVEREYALEVSCQQPFDHGVPTVRFAPVTTVGTDAQKGYLVVFAGGRLSVRPADTPPGLHAEDPRGIPARFGAGDLAAAVVCYRTTRPDYELDLEVVRHGAADVLPGRVRQVRLVSVVSDDGQMVTRAALQIDVGNLRFLEMDLPEGAEVWSLFVNGRAERPLVEGRTYLVPLQAGGSGPASVECTYGERTAGRGLRHGYEGPRFNLPLADVQWAFYLPPPYRYFGFGGTLLPRRGEEGEEVVFSVDQYARDNTQLVEQNVKKAEAVMQQGARLARQGRNLEARQALEEAIAYSQGREDLNEDARIQYRNLLRQQAVVGFANRRSALKATLNAAGEDEIRQMRAFNEGNFDAEYGRQVEQSLGAKESDSLGVLANKLLDQQDAAEAEVHPIRITLPVQGRRFAFHRELQIRPGAPMRVTFRAVPGRLAHAGFSVAAGAGLALLAGAALRLGCGGRGRAAA